MKEMRAAAASEKLSEGHEELILSIALPGGPFHGDYFLVPKLAEYGKWKKRVYSLRHHKEFIDIAPEFTF